MPYKCIEANTGFPKTPYMHNAHNVVNTAILIWNKGYTYILGVYNIVFIALGKSSIQSHRLDVPGKRV